MLAEIAPAIGNDVPEHLHGRNGQSVSVSAATLARQNAALNVVENGAFIARRQLGDLSGAQCDFA